jgi:hypothetical protein
MASKIFKLNALTAALLMAGTVHAQTPAAGVADPPGAARAERIDGRPDAGSQPHRGINGPRPGDRAPG